MSRNAENILHWARLNRLKLNVEKTKAIVIVSYFYINKLSDMAISGIVIDQTFIKFALSVRNLGVWLDSKLNWKANSLLYRLNYFRMSTKFMLCKHLIETLVFFPGRPLLSGIH